MDSPLGGLALLAPKFVLLRAGAIPVMCLTGRKDLRSGRFVGRPVTLPELKDYLSQRGVATHARPDVLAAMASLPVAAVGKIDKKDDDRRLQA